MLHRLNIQIPTSISDEDLKELHATYGEQPANEAAAKQPLSSEIAATITAHEVELTPVASTV